MEKAVLHATHRTVIGKQVGALRREGKLPAVMYGHHIDSTPITLDLRDATLILSRLTSSSLVTIELDGKEHAALIREKQRDFIRGMLKHVDFQILSLTEKLRTTVSIELTGLAPAIKDFNGVVVTGINQVEVECLPQDLPERIIVDVSHLSKIGDGIHVRDIKLSDKVTILEDSDEMVVLITAPAAEEAAEEAAVPGAEEPEVIEHGKKEEEEAES
ncbi:MAG: 50S ribosomal protein L25 [Anaerolineaceae bacterium]|nr:50S ribosomal protein L25 [Anaerolineaceae bacterium]